VPRVMRIDVFADGENISDVEVPHQPFDEVFHEEIIEALDEQTGSEFVAGLAELIARRTETGAGLYKFLDENLDQFNSQVASEIRLLANEVTQTEETVDA
jgi:hypothetical protein